MGSGAADLELQYRGGWTIQHTTGPDDWNRVAVRGDSRIEQGGRTYGQLLAGLDRIDGRPVLGDFIAGLQAGLSQESSKPLPFGPDGEPLPAGAAPEPPDYSTGRLPPWAYRSANRAANNYIDARNEQSLRWLRWTGFKLLEAHPEHGREKRLFFTFARFDPHV